MSLWHTATNTVLVTKLLETTRLIARLGGDEEAPQILLELEREVATEVVFRMRHHEIPPTYIGDVDLAGAAERVAQDA